MYLYIHNTTGRVAYALPPMIMKNHAPLVPIVGVLPQLSEDGFASFDPTSRESDAELYAHVVCVWYCKHIRDGRRRKRKTITKVLRAASILQGFALCILARKRLRNRADQVYARVWDEDESRYYYYHRETGASSWVKPVSIYLEYGDEPPVFEGSVE